MKVAIQKGPIKCDMPVQKTMTRKQIDNEDAMHDRQRKDGMVPKLLTPSKKK